MLGLNPVHWYSYIARYSSNFYYDWWNSFSRTPPFENSWIQPWVIFSSLALLSSSVFMTNLSSVVAASFSSLARLSSSVSTANLSTVLETTFSSLRFISNSLSSLVVFCFLIFMSYPAFLSSVLRFLKLCFNRPMTLSMHVFGPRNSAHAFFAYVFFVWFPIDKPTHHAKSQLNTPVWGLIRSPNK